MPGTSHFISKSGATVKICQMAPLRARPSKLKCAR